MTLRIRNILSDVDLRLRSFKYDSELGECELEITTPARKAKTPEQKDSNPGLYILVVLVGHDLDEATAIRQSEEMLIRYKEKIERLLDAYDTSLKKLPH